MTSPASQPPPGGWVCTPSFLMSGHQQDYFWCGGCPQTRAQRKSAGYQAGSVWCCGSTPRLGLDPSPATFWLCDLGKISQPLCASDSSSVGAVAGLEWLLKVILPTAAVRVLRLGKPGRNQPFGGHSNLLLPTELPVPNPLGPLETAGRGQFCTDFPTLRVNRSPSCKVRNVKQPLERSLLCRAPP